MKPMIYTDQLILTIPDEYGNTAKDVWLPLESEGIGSASKNGDEIEKSECIASSWFVFKIFLLVFH